MTIDQGETRGAVLRAYGEAMDIVQFWELAQAMVWWRESAPHNRTTPIQNIGSASARKEIIRLQAAFMDTTAEKARAAIEPLLTDEERDLLKRARRTRNWLSHNALRQRRLDDGSFDPGTHAEIVAAGELVAASLRTIAAVIEDRFAGPGVDALPGWEEAVQGMLDRLKVGQRVIDKRSPA